MPQLESMFNFIYKCIII